MNHLKISKLTQKDFNLHNKQYNNYKRIIKKQIINYNNFYMQNQIKYIVIFI